MKQIKLKDYKYGYIVGMCIIVITAGSAIIRSINSGNVIEGIIGGFLLGLIPMALTMIILIKVLEEYE